MSWIVDQADAAAAPNRAVWLRRVWSLSGLLLIAATWRLWTPQSVFPRVPLFAAAGGVPDWCDWLGGLALLLGLLGVLGRPASRVGQYCAWIVIVALSLLICIDQHRLQPWAYQLLLFSALMTARAPPFELAFARLLLVSIYLFSALSKLDYLFLRTLGQQFLETLVLPLGWQPQTWPPAARLLGAGLFPAGELLIAIGLLLPATRKASAKAAVALHVVLLFILGPWGLRHQLGVLIWNVSFVAQLVVLFLLAPAAVARPALPEAPRFWRRIVGGLMTAVLFLPLLEPWGGLDHWLAWQVYAPRNSRAMVYILRTQADRLPDDLQPLLAADDGLTPWRRLDIDRWSLRTLGAPLYPQDRFQLGVALAVADRWQLGKAIRVVQQDAANRWTGRRKEHAFLGADELRAVVGSRVRRDS
jgi:hypothetical protein